MPGRDYAMARSFALSVLTVTAALLPGNLARYVKRSASAPAPVASTTCSGQTYVYEELAGVGLLPGTSRDKYGDTIGGIGSAAVVDPKTWTLNEDGSYTGTLWGLPDRGWYVALLPSSGCPPPRAGSADAQEGCWICLRHQAP